MVGIPNRRRTGRTPTDQRKVGRKSTGTRAQRIRNLPIVRPALIRKVRRAGLETRIIEERFRKEGPGWASLSPATVKARGSAHPILRQTGALKAATLAVVRGTFDPGRMDWPGLVRRLRVSYGAALFKGTRSMPARRFLRNPTDRELAPATRLLRKLERRYINTGRI